MTGGGARPVRRLTCSLLLLSSLAAAKCIPFTEAGEKIGATVCVTGKVLKVVEGKGAWFLNFCEDFRTCPFQVVVFARDLRDVGDVRLLEGKTIEIDGAIKEYDGRAEIILRRVRQLKGDAAKIPPMPKTYDVERRSGGFSAGRMQKPKKGSRETAPRPENPPANPTEPNNDDLN